MIPVNIFHSNSVGIASIRFISLKLLFFELRCDTIDDSGVSTQRHDDEDKCAKMI